MKNAITIIALTFVAAAVVMAAFIASRLSEQAVSLLTGIVFGLLLGLPIGAAIGWYIRGHRPAERIVTNAQPVVYVSQPPSSLVQGYAALPANHVWNGSYAVGQGAPMSAPRQFVIGGEEIVYHEPDAIR